MKQGKYINQVKNSLMHRASLKDIEFNPVELFVQHIKSTFPIGYQSPYPSAIMLSLTSGCNLRCKHCFHYFDQNYFKSTDEDLSLERCIELIDEASQFKIFALTLSGGEPFYRKDVFKILIHAKKRRIPLYIHTNAALLNEAKIKKLKNILNPYTDMVQVSLDGATADIHDSIRGKGVFNKAISNTRLMIEQNINVVLNYTVMSVNQHELLDFYKLANSIEVPWIQFNRFIPENEGHLYLVPAEDKVLSQESEMIAYIKENKVITKYNGTLYGDMFNLFNLNLCPKDEVKLFKKFMRNSAKEFNCMQNPSKICISSTGDAALCDSARELTFLGNCKDSSLFALWDKRFGVIDNLHIKVEKAVCKKCEYLDTCKMGCPGITYKVTGDVNAPDPRCKHALKLIERENINNK